MSKDRIKREIDFREKLFLGCVAIIAGMLSFLGTKVSSVTDTVSVVFVAAIVILIALIIFAANQYMQIKSLLKEL